MVLLDSVGTFLDTDNGMTYPANVDNTPDMECGIPLEDIKENEWVGALSDEDFDVVADYLSGTGVVEMGESTFGSKTVHDYMGG